ncbi:MAG: MarR family winged helix-turn-helix transcriptional regulator [Gaiellaceae bacterium]
MSPQVTHRAQPTAPAVRAWTRLLRAYAATARCLSPALLDEHGLTLNDYEALKLLAEAEGRRMRRVDLAGALSLSASGVTRLLEGLEEDGLVQRATCPHDRRVAYAQLTDEGARRLQAASCGHAASIRDLLEETLTEDELDELAELLGKVAGEA